MSKFLEYIPQPFPIYKALTGHPSYPAETHYQNHQLSQCNGDLSTYRNVLPWDGTKIGMPSFMIYRTSGGALVTSFALINQATGASVAVTGVTSVVEDLDAGPDYEALIFNSQSFTKHIEVGAPYYITFNDGIYYWYSDIFTFERSITLPGVVPFSQMPTPCGANDWAQLIWSNPGSVISEKFPSGIGFRLNLAANFCRPEYLYKPETEDDGQGGKDTHFQRLDKRWTFFILAPEYIADALSAMQMFSDVVLTFQYGDSVLCREIEVDVDWKTACHAEVSVSFGIDFLIRTPCG